MNALCDVLHVSVNDLLSGEVLSSEKYNQKAEEHMMDLMKTSEENNRANRRAKVTTMIGGIVGFTFVFLFYISNLGIRNLAWYIDIPSFVGATGLPLLFLTFGGYVHAFFDGFYICIRKFKEKDGTPVAAERIKRSAAAMRFAIRMTLLSGGLGFLFAIPIILHAFYSTPEMLGPNLAVAVLTAFYACLLALIIYPFYMRLFSKMGTD